MRQTYTGNDFQPLWRGRQVLENLAPIYEQLYVRPGKEGEALYKKIVLGGEHAPTKDLSHFHSTEEDSCGFLQTPAGQIKVITLCDREDFELFFQIMANKCSDIPVPKTIGASLLDGVINRRKIEAHQLAFLQKKPQAEGEEPYCDTWEEEWERFVKDRKNYTDVCIILSQGPYSAVTALQVGYSQKEWLSLSQTIRLYHEGTHFVCRRFYKEKIDPIWDELIADGVGIYAALGRMDIPLAQKVLGITQDSYTGGRLENYLPKDTTDKQAYITALLPKIHQVMVALEELCEGGELPPFEVALKMEEKKESLW